MNKCLVCDTDPMCFVWTDTHGVAQCDVCGAPYDLKKDNECLLKPDWVHLMRQYRKETGCIIPSGHSFPGGQELATDLDKRAFEDWCDQNTKENEESRNSA